MSKEKRKEDLEANAKSKEAALELEEIEHEKTKRETEEEPQTEEETQDLADDEKLVDKVEELEQELQELQDNYLRLNAEYDNYRKRTTKEKSSIYPQATADTVGCFLPIIDNFERAMEYDATTDEFKEGIEMIHHSLGDILEKLNVESIGERGEPFDPALHNAVMHIEDDELPDQCVSQVLQKGYKIGDRVLRHAMVETAN